MSSRPDITVDDAEIAARALFALALLAGCLAGLFA
jgi:hypothetical protein